MFFGKISTDWTLLVTNSLSSKNNHCKLKVKIGTRISYAKQYKHQNTYNL